MKWILIVLGTLIVVVILVYVIGMLMEVTHKATAQRKFKVSANQIWLILTDFKDYKSWRSGIKELRVDGDRQWTETNSYGDNVSYALEIIAENQSMKTQILNKDLPYGGYWEFTLSSDPGGCVLSITENGEVYNPFFRFMSKYIFGHDTSLKTYMKDLEARAGG